MILVILIIVNCLSNEEDLSIARSRDFKCWSHFLTTLTGRDWMSAHNLQRIPGLWSRDNRRAPCPYGGDRANIMYPQSTAIKLVRSEDFSPHKTPSDFRHHYKLYKGYFTRHYIMTESIQDTSPRIHPSRSKKPVSDENCPPNLSVGSWDYFRLRRSNFLITLRTNSDIKAPINASCHNPHPAALPKAADTQIAAAEVRPWTSTLPISCWLCRRISPPPKNPIPAAMPWITRSTASSPFWFLPIASGIKTNNAEPILTSIWVLNPAGLFLSWRSHPIIPPTNMARHNLNSMPSQLSGDHKLAIDNVLLQIINRKIPILAEYDVRSQSYCQILLWANHDHVNAAPPQQYSS